MQSVVSIAEAVAILKSGGVGILPTDTVYGLVACANHQVAVQRMYALKQREHKPGTIIVANIDQLVSLGIKRRYVTAVEQWWPNPLSIVIPASDTPPYLRQGQSSLAFRIPDSPHLRDMLDQTGPLVTSSANDPGQPTANTVQEAIKYFGDTVDFYVDGGDLSGRAPSTIIRVVDDAIEVLRPGALAIDENGRITI